MSVTAATNILYAALAYAAPQVPNTEYLDTLYVEVNDGRFACLFDGEPVNWYYTHVENRSEQVEFNQFELRSIYCGRPLAWRNHAMLALRKGLLKTVQGKG